MAFISYSHKDAAMGRWLHRKLEGYRLPKRLAGTEGEDGRVPARLTPIFRDRDDLPAAGDLSERVRAALAVSRKLIVLCSPHSAASPWVAREIATFRELHPGRPVFTAIVGGDPGQCFSPALLQGGVEPLAADLRKEGDGRRLGLLKLVAGLAGVGLDALVQRDAARRVRRVTYVTAAALAAMLAMALLTAFALNARAEAERQRAEAEGLVEFMLTDLRDRLKGVGRLDVLTAVNKRALDHYRHDDLETLPADALERRARILHAMGEDDEKRGLTDQALAQFREAARTTKALLNDEPDNPERIFDHGQSEYWIGFIDYQRRNYAAARPAFVNYRNLSVRLAKMQPNNSDYIREAGYAEGNMCSLALQEPKSTRAAIDYCAAALRYMQLAARRSGSPEETGKDIANRHAWLADAYRAAGNPSEAVKHRETERKIIERLLSTDPNNAKLRAVWLWSLRGRAKLEFDLHRPNEGRARLRHVLTELDKLVALDPDNKEWRKGRDEVRKEIINYRRTI
ncbi:MAG TPA: toll/interleukin-1 receptor domain-containing protein [Allosphingosinicella sp.]